MSRRSERNHEAYLLGYRGKAGGEAGAYEAKLAYEKTRDFAIRYSDIQDSKNEHPQAWHGISDRDIRTAIDAAQFNHPSREGLEKWVHNFPLIREVFPEAPMSDLIDYLTDDDLLQELSDDGFGEFWYH